MKISLSKVLARIPIKAAFIFPKQLLLLAKFFSILAFVKNIVLKIAGNKIGLRHILATECFLKIIKNAFYFALKVLFVLKVSRFLS